MNEQEAGCAQQGMWQEVQGGPPRMGPISKRESYKSCVQLKLHLSFPRGAWTPGQSQDSCCLRLPLTCTPTPRAIPGVAAWSSRLCASPAPPRSVTVLAHVAWSSLWGGVGGQALEGSWPGVAILTFLEPRLQARPVLRGLGPSCWDLWGP